MHNSIFLTVAQYLNHVVTHFRDCYFNVTLLSRFRKSRLVWDVLLQETWPNFVNPDLLIYHIAKTFNELLNLQRILRQTIMSKRSIFHGLASKVIIFSTTDVLYPDNTIKFFRNSFAGIQGPRPIGSGPYHTRTETKIWNSGPDRTREMYVRLGPGPSTF